MDKVIKDTLVDIQYMIIDRDMVTFLLITRSCELYSYDCYESNRLGARDCYNGNSVNMDKRFHKRKGDYEGYYESYNFEGYNCRRSFQTLGTTSRLLSYNKFKLPLSCGTFGPYDYEAWEQKVESLIYSYCLNVRWNCICENRRRMGAQGIKTWSFMKQSLKNRFGIENYEGQRQGQAKIKCMEPSIVEEAPKVKELSQAKIEETLKIHVMEETSNEDTCCILNEKSIGIKEKEKVENKETLVERSCIFDSISIFSRKSEHLEC
ncbi:hypothetical protein M9H77_22395 [Catharanthus roseus]|uniref:Uncharacterized protein n=1 Tax=Catharanthus roseus TaxID=4058 RepID=A0ACC0APZ9_CATRO|nr:hypothetical protein M9H77_22395 [Catharanthus roseus]